jgi:two-component system phosphate regulon sensor histidine kinase PhoR
VDNGHGIPEAELDKIMEPFYMVDKSRARKQGGAGLGLALCRKIAEIHNGSISVRSELGKGTEVCFEVNLAGEGNE